jgi:CheY-like chemotaxis protein
MNLARTLTILLVEDNADDEVLTLRALRKFNPHTHIDVVRDGAEALAYLFQADEFHGMPAPLPEVIFLDLKLPKLDGLKVLEAIRNHPTTTRIPVVILTSSDEEVDIAASYAMGANSYVRKPVEFEDFMDVVGKLGVYWLSINQPPPAS